MSFLECLICFISFNHLSAFRSSIKWICSFQNTTKWKATVSVAIQTEILNKVMNADAVDDITATSIPGSVSSILSYLWKMIVSLPQKDMRMYWIHKANSFPLKYPSRAKWKPNIFASSNVYKPGLCSTCQVWMEWTVSSLGDLNPLGFSSWMSLP